MIKGARIRSSVDTLVERTTGFVVLAKMDNATTKAVVESFALVLNREPPGSNAHHRPPTKAARYMATKLGPMSF